MPGNTSTGGVLESMVLPSLVLGGYHYRKRVNIGLRVGAERRHFIDAIAWKDSQRLLLISSKWQQIGGTAEQKVPFEIISLMSAITRGVTIPAPLTCEHCRDPLPSSFAEIIPYVVLGGDAWTLRQFYVNGGLREFIPASDVVTILTLESFVARANNGGL